MRRGGILVAVGLVLSGCKYFDKSDRADRAPPGFDRTFPAVGRKDRDRDRYPDDVPTASVPRQEPHWLDGPASRAGRGDLPPSPTGRRSDPYPAETDEVRPVRGVGSGILAGYVTDEFGRKLRGVYVEISPADRAGPGAPTGVETGEDGSFQIEGLYAGQTYILSAKTQREGVKLAGQVYAQPPNPRLMLRLKEGFSLPDAGSRANGPEAGADLGIHRRPPPVPLAADRDSDPNPLGRDKPDGSWAPPGAADAPPAPAPGRPELTTEGRAPDFRPPATNIPPPPPPASDPDRSESRSIRSGSEFVLVDTLGRTREFPTARDGELLLLEFLTTTCVPCKKAIPALKELQSRYGAQGLEVIGVVCDEVGTPQRRAVASAYQGSNALNYLLYVEPGNRPGAVMNRFGVEFYPTMVLINSVGDVVWKGDPRQLVALERAIQDNLGR